MLAQRYAREFDSKWLRGERDPAEPFIGSADIQSLADLGNSFEVIKTMRFVPVHQGDGLSAGSRHGLSAGATPADDDFVRRAAEAAAERRVLRCEATPPTSNARTP